MNLKKTLLLFLFFTIYDTNVKAQESQNNYIQKNISGLSSTINTSSVSVLEVFAVLFPFNPVFLIEDKKFYVGITKELSLSLYPVGRVAAEYSLIFRETDLNQLRFSYNYDIPVLSSDYAAVFLSLGGGYFTDFKKEGYFPQLSANFIIPATDIAVINAYFKIRNTFVNETSGSDVFDVSFGLGSIFTF